MVTSRTSPPLQSAKEKLDVHKRHWCNLHLLMWHLCANTACRRARCCRGDPTACFDRNFRQLPEGVQDWFALLAKFQGADVPFDEAWAERRGSALLTICATGAIWCSGGRLPAWCTEGNRADMLADGIALSFVMRGLDPRIHAPTKKMDCRIKSGNDAGD